MLRLFILALVASGVANAQGISLDSARLAWGDLLAFSVLVGSVIAFARQHLPFVKELKGFAVSLLSVAVGGVLGLVGAFVFGAPPTPFVALGHPLGGILFGLSAGGAASGGYDLIKSVLGLVGGSVKPAGTTKDDSERGRL